MAIGNKGNTTGRGWLKLGQFGNPGGRPKSTASLQLAARAHMHAMLKALVERAKQGNVTAATRVLEFGFGRATQSVEMRLDEAMFHKKISEMSPAELAAFEQRLIEMGVGEAVQAEMFDGHDAH
jgi:hypothetical protein